MSDRVVPLSFAITASFAASIVAGAIACAPAAPTVSFTSAAATTAPAASSWHPTTPINCRSSAECGEWMCRRDDQEMCGAHPVSECGDGCDGGICHQESPCDAALCRPRCHADADCDRNHACNRDGDCVRKACIADRDCGNYCIEGKCSAELGVCVDPNLPPPP